MRRLKQIASFLRPFAGLLIVAVVLTGVLTAIGMVAPLLMRRLINDVAREGRWDIFPLVIGLMLVVPVLRAVVNIANSISLNTVGLGIVRKTRRRLFRHLMALSVRFYNETPVGSINQRLMGDVNTVSTVVTGGLIALAGDMVAVAFAIVVMLRISPQLSLLTFALLPAYLLNYRFFSKRIRANTAVLRSHMDHISSTLQERLSAHELIQSYGQDRAEGTFFSSQAKQVMNAAVRGAAYSTSFNHLSAFVTKVGNTLIYCAGAYFVIKETMGYGDVVAFCAYATNILGPVTRFAGVANQVVQVGVSIDRINEVLDREPAIRESPEPEPVETLKGDIKVEGVAFSYGGEEPALTGCSLDIPAGTHVAVVGPAGSGRTTLAMLLRRFYDPAEGRIIVDGTDVRDYRLSDFRAALAMVLPESSIFAGTIAENLRYGNPEAPEDRMVEVSTALGLHEFVDELAEGYDTKIGPGGLMLSTGIRQKVGLARALLSDPLVLILDEATASLDPESAHAVNEAVRRAMEGRTCVIVVNRVLMAEDADEVLVMQGGRVVEAGEHEGLLRTEGSLYRDLFARQYGEDRLPPAEE
ncbi:MAG: ABC transporter ATP-binding protein [Candidatus Brocadiia bacterium]